MKTTTLEALRAAALGTISKEMETDPVPEAIERMCAARAGKPLTKKDAEALEEQFPGLDVYIGKSHGVTLEWSVSVSFGGYIDDRRMPDDHVSASGYTGRRDANGDAIYTEEMRQKRLALYRMGVPSPTNRTGVQIRTWSDARTGGVTRWPSVEELRENNPRHYGARDKRNAQRAAAQFALESEALDLPVIAALVDEINERAAQLREFMRQAPAELRRAVADMVNADTKPTSEDE